MLFRELFRDDLHGCLLDELGDDVEINGTVRKAIWNRPYFENSTAGDFDIKNRDTSIEVPLNYGVSVGDPVVFQGIAYTVTELQPDGQERTVAHLRKA